MENQFVTPQEINTPSKELWHEPEVVRAEINHDTASFMGSFLDGMSGSF
jgi:hypothetical protein